MRPLAADTSSRVEAILLEHYRQLDGPEKMAIVWELTELAEEAALTGIRERHPNATESELGLRLAALKYGRDVVLRACGWDPLVQGW